MYGPVLLSGLPGLKARPGGKQARDFFVHGIIKQSIR